MLAHQALVGTGVAASERYEQRRLVGFDGPLFPQRSS